MRADVDLSSLHLQKTTQLTATKLELQSAQMQRKVVKDLLDDKNAEVDVLYEVSLISRT